MSEQKRGCEVIHTPHPDGYLEYVEHHPDCPSLPANHDRYTMNNFPFRECRCDVYRRAAAPGIATPSEQEREEVIAERCARLDTWFDRSPMVKGTWQRGTRELCEHAYEDGKLANIQALTGDKPAGSHETDLEGRAGKPRAADAKAPAVGIFVPTKDAGARPAPELAQGSATPDVIADVVKEMRSMQRVAGQASVEQADPVMAQADARFAEYAGRWADRLASLLPKSQPSTEGGS